VDEPLAQTDHYENAERMLLATFVSGLAGEPGRQVRYANPSTMEKALHIALSVEQAERQEKYNEAFYARFESSPNLKSRSPSRTLHDALRCYECEGVEHFARACPTRLKREENFTNSPGRRNPSERSRRSRPPEHKPTHTTRKAAEKGKRRQEN
jgi:hypothetical protein